MPKYLELAIYRTVQELMLNVAKYAQATSVSTTITVTQATITINVADHGKGIVSSTSKKTGIGLSSIRSN